MKYQTKSALIARMPRGEEEYKKVIIKLFSTDNPHRKNVLPEKTLEFPNTRKVVIKGLEISYLTEGNDILINDLKDISVGQIDAITLEVTGTQTG